MFNNLFKVRWKWKNADVFSFFVTRKCQKSKKSMKIANIEQRNSSYLLNDLRNFNEISKNHRGVKLTPIPPPSPDVLGLSRSCIQRALSHATTQLDTRSSTSFWSLPPLFWVNASFHHFKLYNYNFYLLLLN